MNRPNTFIVGAPKTATSALASYLREHPGVFFSAPKEPFYWCSDFPEMARAINLGEEHAYYQLFASEAANRAKVRAEGSTHYLLSQDAIPRIERECPGSKYIAMLRNPVEVVHAYHGELVFHLQEDVLDFEQAWRLRDARLQGNQLPKGMRSLHNTQYHRFAMYADQLERFFQAVPPDRRMVILFEDFRQDPGAAYRGVLNFLELPDDGRTEFPKIYESRRNRFKWIAQLQHHPPRMMKPLVLGTRFFFDKYAGQAFMRSVRKLVHAPNKRGSLSAAFQQELRDFFADDVAKTSKLLNRDLHGWLGETHPTSPSLVAQGS